MRKKEKAKKCSHNLVKTDENKEKEVLACFKCERCIVKDKPKAIGSGLLTGRMLNLAENPGRLMELELRRIYLENCKFRIP